MTALSLLAACDQQQSEKRPAPAPLAAPVVQVDAAVEPDLAIDAGVDAPGGGGALAPAVERTGPTCTKGCPCGNACISCSKTCHVGEGTAHRRRK